LWDLVFFLEENRDEEGDTAGTMRQYVTLIRLTNPKN
jgi:hypothetical protein